MREEDMECFGKIVILKEQVFLREKEFNELDNLLENAHREAISMIMSNIKKEGIEL